MSLLKPKKLKAEPSKDLMYDSVVICLRSEKNNFKRTPKHHFKKQTTKLNQKDCVISIPELMQKHA